MKLIAALAIASVLALTGCDTLYGLRRSASVARLPPVDEIKEVISHVSGVKEVSVMFVQPPKHFSLYDGIGKDPDYSQFSITGQAAFTVLTIGKEKEKEVAFYSLWMNRRPTPEELGRAAALMDTVYDALLEKFPWLPPKNEFKQAPNQPPEPTAPSGRGSS